LEVLPEFIDELYVGWFLLLNFLIGELREGVGLMETQLNELEKLLKLKQSLTRTRINFEVSSSIFLVNFKPLNPLEPF
jgi:hypothetical protein